MSTNSVRANSVRAPIVPDKTTGSSGPTILHGGTERAPVSARRLRRGMGSPECRPAAMTSGGTRRYCRLPIDMEVPVRKPQAIPALRAPERRPTRPRQRWRDLASSNRSGGWLRREGRLALHSRMGRSLRIHTQQETVRNMTKPSSCIVGTAAQTGGLGGKPSK
jgi:hypothetical protein